MAVIDIRTKIKMQGGADIENEPVKRAVAAFYRDLAKTCTADGRNGIDILLVRGTQKKECYEICCASDALEICASDALGFIYGIYRVSEEILGIAPFWFWNDQVIKEQDCHPVPDGWHVQSQPFRVKLRGWFINDEVLLHTWSVNRRKEEPWEMAFEALLRLGGNLVIPGTDKNSILYRGLAGAMGLTVTHHHAEPLGAEMFARSYPTLTASYEEHSDKFKGLWQDAIEAQKELSVIWNLGFRGQGDVPFWENDPRYETDEARGELMSRLIGLQYDMVKKQLPKAVCCTNLYGETMELYRQGFLKLPEDVIRIWADNGFGRMVTRRQGNHNPRICSLPQEGDGGCHGIYYHVSFYDLQAANHMTMLANPPEFVVQELTDALRCGADDYWLINCSNIKPHVYFLDLIAEMWKDGHADVEAHRRAYAARYYGAAAAKRVESCLRDYHRFAVLYGKHADDHAGEQFANHVARMLICQYIKDQSTPSADLRWATDASTLEEQVLWYQKICGSAAQRYGDYVQECERAESELTGHARRLFADSVLLQAKLHSHCFCGADFSCRAILCGIAGDYQKAFFYAGKGKGEYEKANQSMRDCEHGKWKGFYANECLTDIKQSAWVLAALMAYLRCLGDGPHYYQWQRDFLYSEEDRRVMLVMNMENHLTDMELFALMEEKWDELPSVL